MAALQDFGILDILHDDYVDVDVDVDDDDDDDDVDGNLITKIEEIQRLSTIHGPLCRKRMSFEGQVWDIEIRIN